MKTLSTILLAIVLLFTLSQLDQPVQALQEYQLNLSHIECRGTYIEIHFVLLNTVQGDVISDLTYTYGTSRPVNAAKRSSFYGQRSPGFL